MTPDSTRYSNSFQHHLLTNGWRCPSRAVRVHRALARAKLIAAVSVGNGRAMRRWVPLILANLALVLVMNACGGGNQTPTAPSTATVTPVSVAGSTSFTAAAQTSQFTATASLSNGTTQNVTSQATWLSSNTAVATVSSTGLVTAVATGTATVTATYQEKAGTAQVTVTIGGPPFTYDVVSMTFAIVNPIPEAATLTRVDLIFDGSTIDTKIYSPPSQGADLQSFLYNTVGRGRHTVVIKVSGQTSSPTTYKMVFGLILTFDGSVEGTYQIPEQEQSLATGEGFSFTVDLL